MGTGHQTGHSPYCSEGMGWRMKGWRRDASRASPPRGQNGSVHVRRGEGQTECNDDARFDQISMIV